MPKQYRVNREIRTREVRVIGDGGEQLGVMPLIQALEVALERDLDLVEVAPNAVPPVCRVLDYGKFRYLRTKKEREARKGQRANLLRQVRFRPRIGTHDIEAKGRQVRKLLEEGAKVKVSVLFRGREITHPELGVGLLKRIADSLKEESKLEQPPSMEGRMLSIILAPVQKDDKEEKVPKPALESADAQTEDP